MFGRRFERPAVVRCGGRKVAFAMLREPCGERNPGWIGGIDRFHSSRYPRGARGLPVRRRALGEVALDLVARDDARYQASAGEDDSRSPLDRELLSELEVLGDRARAV